MEFKISVIIPVYNKEKYLHRCLESIINQTLKDIEIIIINDGSTDNSLETLNQYASLDSRIRIINQDNQGLSYSRNIGILNATSPLIFFIDGDDCIELETLADMHKVMINQNSDIVHSKIRYIFNDRKVIETNNYDGSFSPKEIFRKSLSLILPPSAAINLYKKELFVNNNIFFPENMYFEDTAVVYKLFYFSKNISIINKAYYNYFIDNDNSITSMYTEKHIKDFISALDMTKFFLKEQKIYKLYINDFNCKVNTSCYSMIKRISQSKLLIKDKSFILSFFWKEIEKYNFFNLTEIQKVNLLCESMAEICSLSIKKIEYDFGNKICSMGSLERIYQSVKSPAKEVNLLIENIRIQKPKSIYIYGIGETLIKIKSKLNDIQVLGVIDKKLNNIEYFETYKVVTLQEVIKKNDNINIVIASIKFAEEISDMISSLDKKNKVNIINYYGNLK